jgi:hypothetical protein
MSGQMMMLATLVANSGSLFVPCNERKGAQPLHLWMQDIRQISVRSDGKNNEALRVGRSFDWTISP